MPLARVEIMLRLGLVLLIPAFVALSLTLGRRRRRRNGELRLGTLPAGLRHMASQVGALSNFDMGLSLPAPGSGRRRGGGTLIGVR